MAVIPISSYMSGTQVDLSNQVGPPTSGTYSGNAAGGGNWGIDSNGFIWTCIASSVNNNGGTWVSGGRLSAGGAGGGGGGGAVTLNDGGANGASVLVGDTGQNSLLISGARKEVTYSNSAVGATAPIDVSDYVELSIQPTQTGVGGVTQIEVSNSPTGPWNVLNLQRQDGVPQNVQQVSSTALVYRGSIIARYLRVNTTALTSGVASGIIELRTQSSITTTVQGTVNGSQASNDGFNGTVNNAGISTLGFNYGYNGSTWDRRRTPLVFKEAALTNTGNIWTPTAGKKFRLMGYRIDVTANATAGAAAVLAISLIDGASAINHSLRAFVPTTVTAGSLSDTTTGWIYLENGVLSAAANNVLSANFSFALTGGTAYVLAVGTEE